MKVLQVYKDYYPPVRGGIEGHINLLATGLKRRGYDVSVLVSNTGFHLLEEEIDGIRVTRVPQVGRFTSAPINMTFIHWLKKLARDADVLHFHFPNPTAEFSYLLTGLDKRVIVTYHSDIVRQARLGKIYSPFMKRFLDKAETIIATSPAYLNSSAVLNQYRFKCKVVPLGIDLSRFSSEKRDESSIDRVRRAYHRPIILFIGRFRYYKGLHILIEAMKEVDAVLLMIGTGPLEKALREQAAAADLGAKVIFLGERSRPGPGDLPPRLRPVCPAVHSPQRGVRHRPDRGHGVQKTRYQHRDHERDLLCQPARRNRTGRSPVQCA